MISLPQLQLEQRNWLRYSRPMDDLPSFHTEFGPTRALGSGLRASRGAGGPMMERRDAVRLTAHEGLSSASVADCADRSLNEGRNGIVNAVRAHFQLPNSLGLAGGAASHDPVPRRERQMGDLRRAYYPQDRYSLPVALFMSCA